MPEEPNIPNSGETPGAGPTEMVPLQNAGETPGSNQPSSPTVEDALKQIADLQAALKKANTESATHRHKAKELDDLKAKIEAEKLSETEKLQKQLSTLQSQHDLALRQSQERAVGYEVRLQAAQMGIVDPDAAAKLLDWSELEYDEDGSPKNVATLLKELLKKKPYLIGKVPTPTSGGATNPSRSSTNAPKELSWAVISAMTPQEYDTRRPEIQKWMQNNPPRFR